MARKYPTWKPVPSKTAKAPAPPTDFSRAEDGRRVKDVNSARSIYNKLVADNVARFAQIVHVRNQLEGGRPRDQAQLEANGSGWETNVNFGDAQASCNRTLIPYWKMVNDVPRAAAFTIPSDAPQTEKYQVAFAECYDEFLEDWGEDYKQQFMRMCSNFVKFGPGIMQYCDKENPRYKSVNVTRMLFPKNCQMSMDQWEVVALTRDISAAELYGYVKTKKDQQESAYAGWNTDVVKATIVQCMHGGPNPDYRDYTRYQDMLVNNDISVTTPYSPITIVYLYVKRFDGKIGCRAFTQTAAAGLNDFLYKDDEEGDLFSQLFSACWYDTGTEGMVHSIKGFGIKNYYFSSLINRVKSRAVDAGTLGMGMNFQYADNNMPDETPPVENYGAITVFPSGMTQVPVYPPYQTSTTLLAMLQNNESENNSLYRQQNQQIAESDTATQANLLATMQGQLSEASASLFLAQYSQAIAEQVRRLRIKGSKNEDAKNFQRRLKERGVPDEIIFTKEIRVRTGANAGMANTALRAQKFQQGLALSSQPGVNGRWFLENFIAELYGSQAVSKAMLPEGAESNPIQRRQAIMENTDFGQGVMLQAAPQDAHVEHLEEHMKPAAGIVNAFKQTGQVTPEQAQALAFTMEHAGQHMAFLEKDETQKDKFRAILPSFRLIQSVASGIIQQMTKQKTQGGPPAQSGVAQVVPMR